MRRPENDIYVLRKLQMEVAQLKRVSISCSSGMMVDERTNKMIIFINQMSEKLLRAIGNDLIILLYEDRNRNENRS